jgi:hypothetical protein
VPINDGDAAQIVAWLETAISIKKNVNAPDFAGTVSQLDGLCRSRRALSVEPSTLAARPKLNARMT